jgi:hypothetical protein
MDASRTRASFGRASPLLVELALESREAKNGAGNAIEE